MLDYLRMAPHTFCTDFVFTKENLIWVISTTRGLVTLRQTPILSEKVLRQTKIKNYVSALHCLT